MAHGYTCIIIYFPFLQYTRCSVFGDDCLQFLKVQDSKQCNNLSAKTALVDIRNCVIITNAIINFTNKLCNYVSRCWRPVQFVVTLGYHKLCSHKTCHKIIRSCSTYSCLSAQGSSFEKLLECQCIFLQVVRPDIVKLVLVLGYLLRGHGLSTDQL